MKWTPEHTACASEFSKLLKNDGFHFFTGVPDSLLKDFCACITDNTPPDKHIIAANEGNAIALAAGYHLATGKVALVYMQNSGLGNCINPLTSLTDPKVYSIPMLLMIGWRGEPGKKDEPQHKKMGEIMVETIKSVGIPYNILPGTISDAEKVIKEAIGLKPLPIQFGLGTYFGGSTAALGGGVGLLGQIGSISVGLGAFGESGFIKQAITKLKKSAPKLPTADNPAAPNS